MAAAKVKVAPVVLGHNDYVLWVLKVWKDRIMELNWSSGVVLSYYDKWKKARSSITGNELFNKMMFVSDYQKGKGELSTVAFIEKIVDNSKYESWLRVNGQIPEDTTIMEEQQLTITGEEVPVSQTLHPKTKSVSGEVTKDNGVTMNDFSLENTLTKQQIDAAFPPKAEEDPVAKVAPKRSHHKIVPPPVFVPDPNEISGTELEYSEEEEPIPEPIRAFSAQHPAKAEVSMAIIPDEVEESEDPGTEAYDEAVAEVYDEEGAPWDAPDDEPGEPDVEFVTNNVMIDTEEQYSVDDTVAEIEAAFGNGVEEVRNSITGALTQFIPREFIEGVGGRQVVTPNNPNVENTANIWMPPPPMPHLDLGSPVKYDLVLKLPENLSPDQDELWQYLKLFIKALVDVSAVKGASKTESDRAILKAKKASMSLSSCLLTGRKNNFQ